jgi:hypothetical protein
LLRMGREGGGAMSKTVTHVDGGRDEMLGMGGGGRGA